MVTGACFGSAAKYPCGVVMSRPIDLGQICLCVNAADVDETAAFYERLGFRSTGLDAPKIRRSVTHGSTILTFMSFLERPLSNYRGASIHALITELAASRPSTSISPHSC